MWRSYSAGATVQDGEAHSRPHRKQGPNTYHLALVQAHALATVFTSFPLAAERLSLPDGAQDAAPPGLHVCNAQHPRETVIVGSRFYLRCWEGF